MASEEKKRLLLALAPLLLHPPPIVQTLPLLCSAVGATDTNFVSAEIASVAALAAINVAQPKECSPCPQQGGRRITIQYLEELPDTEALWAFRSVFLNRFKVGIESDARAHPSMTSQDLIHLTDVLQLPDEIFTRGGYRFSSIEAFALTCARLASANDKFDLCARYNWSQSSISKIFNEVIILLDNHWSHLLHFDSDHLLSPANLKRYADAVYETGAPLQGVWGFIDCTIRPMCRPTQHQRQAYNGHKRFHGLKYQAVMLPNGLFGHLFSPIEGRHNDAFALAESGLMDECVLHAKFSDGSEGGGEVGGGIDEGSGQTDALTEPHYLQLFGDPAYGLDEQIISPFPKPGRTDNQQEWNTKMSKVRIEVEHGFALVTNNWRLLKAEWKLRVFLSPVGRYYRVGVLLTNALACLRPNQVSQYFDCTPPSLEDYFHD